MKETPRLYKRAVLGDIPFDALWDIRDGRTYFTGPLYYNASHQHGAPATIGLRRLARLQL